MSEPEKTGISADYLDLFAALIEDFAQATDTEGAVRSALSKIAEAMEAESASLFLIEGELSDPHARLVCKACVGPSDVTGLSLPVSAGIVGRTVQTNRAQIVANTRNDPDFVPPPQSMHYEIRSILCAPLSVKGERLGAVQVINPDDHKRLFGPRDLEALGILSTAAALAMVNAKLGEHRVEQARTRRELELAAGVQRNLLPKPQEPDAPVHGINLPARGVSGDFFDIVHLPGRRIAFALADVSGKGMNAALVMVKAATLFRSLSKRIDQPGVLLARVGDELMETMSMGMFVTMIAGVYNLRTHTIRFSNAGHEPPLLRDRLGVFHSFPAEDPPLGVVAPESGRYPETELKLEGGALYVFSDGCTESRLPDGSMRGSEGLQALIQQHIVLPPQQRLETLAAALAPDNTALRDDMTMLVIDDRRREARSKKGAGEALVTQSFLAQAGQLKLIRRLVAAASQQAGMAEEWSQELVLAVDEACQNIIRHGYKNHEGGRIQLEVKRQERGLAVELVDFAPPVKQDECRGRELNDVRPGGLGTHFMQALTDSVRYLKAPAGAGNRLVLTKRYTKAE
jgi:sigma-B regulation protein RsbU (phosphoserine phosphatase)